MTTSADPRLLEPGTSGWTASDLDDPEIARQWDAGRFEIINGVLKTMPPAFYDHGAVTFELLQMSRDHLRSGGIDCGASVEVDLIIGEDDVVRVDGMLMSRADADQQRAVLVLLGRDPGQIGRVRVAPILVIESVSPGHERHDRVTKRRLYAGFRIPNYWIVDRMRRSLECLVLEGDGYVPAAQGSEQQTVSPGGLFAGLNIELPRLWQNSLEFGG